MWTLKRNDTNELIYKRGRFTDLEDERMVAGGYGGGAGCREGIVREFGRD